jgi:hypothetical protein
MPNHPPYEAAGDIDYSGLYEDGEKHGLRKSAIEI